MKDRRRVLFISHSASRNGATILLLEWLRWLKNVVDWDFEVLIDGQGPLVDEFRSVARTTVWRDPSFLAGVIPARHRAALQCRMRISFLNLLLRNRRFDVIYANTAAAWPHVDALMTPTPTLLWHIHELDYALQVLIPKEQVDRLFRQATGFVAVSDAVRATLMRRYHIQPEKIELVHGFISVPTLSGEARAARCNEVRNRLGWPERAFVVGGCGSLGWRKGTDLFLQVARALGRQNDGADIRFLWIGGGIDDREALEFDHDVRALGLEGRCRRITTTADVLEYYCAMDVFALTSREDPFPLVMLEAGAHGLPVVCFQGSGGAPEFVRGDAGLVAPYQDVPAFVEHLERLYHSPDLRGRCGSVAEDRVRTDHRLDVQAPRLLSAIERQLAGRVVHVRDRNSAA